MLPTVPKTAECLCSFPYLLEDGKAVVERVELSSLSSGFLLAKNLLLLSKRKSLKPAQGVKAPLRAASKDGSFSIPAVSATVPRQISPGVLRHEHPVFPTWVRRVFLLAEPVSFLQSQFPLSPPSHCLVAPAAFCDPTSRLKAASQWLHGWSKTPSLMEVCGILLCFHKSSTEEEDQDVMS